MKKGIDISNWQKDFTNLEILKPNGIEFAIIKISEGQSKDKAFEQHYKGLRAQDIPTGVYVFSHAMTAGMAQREAEFALNILGGRELKLPVFLDLEASDINLAYDMSVMPQALAFGEAVKAAGYKWGVYANRSWWQNKLDVQAVRDAGGVVWCAEYGVIVPKISCDIWQHADNGRIDGYPHNLDMNVMYKTSLLDAENITPVPIEPVNPIPEIIEPKNLPLIRFGDKNSYVWQAQSWLVQLGYDIGPAGIDGEFGPATLGAVKSFQAGNGLEVDGIIGPMSWKKLVQLIEELNPAEPTEPAAPEWEQPHSFVSVSLPLLKYGMAGTGVDLLQILLNATGYYKGSADGYFNESTKRAVMAFQADQKMDTDGIVAADTWEALMLGGG